MTKDKIKLSKEEVKMMLELKKNKDLKKYLKSRAKKTNGSTERRVH